MGVGPVGGVDLRLGHGGPVSYLGRIVVGVCRDWATIVVHGFTGYRRAVGRVGGKGFFARSDQMATWAGRAWCLLSCC